MMSGVSGAIAIPDSEEPNPSSPRGAISGASGATGTASIGDTGRVAADGVVGAPEEGCGLSGGTGGVRAGSLPRPEDGAAATPGALAPGSFAAALA